ncbi:tetratricopeptide repeat protein [Ekhidna sp.]|jgi:protein O-GlcNAc transferase|uniref:O-linked N-acetylglucosamine transferase, SPINDLY family protein n=1 Tax=Ekhidna sp. TaxID=2608089 RepID=UPI0032EB5B71
MEAREYISGINQATKSLNQGELDKAITLCKDLQQSIPERMGAYLVIAQAHLKKNQPGKASEILKEGIKHCDEALLKINLAIVLHKQGVHEEAIHWFEAVERSSAKIPNSKFWFSYAKSSTETGRIHKAIELYEKCLKIKPDHKAALNNLANIYQKREELVKAESFYKKLIHHYPGEGMAYCNLGSLYERSKKVGLAIQYYEKGREVAPHLSIIYYNLGQLYGNEKNDHVKALEVYSDGLLKGDDTYRKGIRFYQIVARQHAGNWSDYEKDISDLNAILQWYVEEEYPPFEIVPYALSYSKVEPELYKKVAERYADKIKREIQQQFPDRSYDHTLSEGKIKVGYLSPNFRQHPGGTLVRQVFDFHDSKRFEIHAFSLVHTDDWINIEIKDSVDYYHDVSKKSSVEIADLINRTGIDVLVSLAGYQTAMKFNVLALRPAPIQMVAIGSHETTGADYVDYVFTDEFMNDHELRKSFSEQVITLPCSLLINSELPFDSKIQTVRSDHGLPEKGFVFANFNHPKKLDPETFSTWMDILNQVPESVLWIYDGGVSGFAESIREKAEQRGIDMKRIICAPPLDIKKHWERFRHADLFLDNFIYNAHVTGIEALRMGIPMVSLKGTSHNSRLGSSLLYYSGFENHICLTKNDYITVSIRLATSAAELEATKEQLQAVDNVILFDTELQVKYLEKAFRKALHKFKKGLAPKDFEVGSALDLNSLIKN